MTEKPARTLFSRATLIVLLLGVSLFLRSLMVAQGGQYFFGDEGRYDRGVQLYSALRSGDFAGVRAVLAMPEHALFPVVGAIVTALQHGLAQFTPYGDWSHPENIIFTMWLGALVLALFSTLNLWLVYCLACATGADESEAFWVFVLAAASNTLFYPARHLLPYSCALSAALLALWVGVGKSSPGRAFSCGILAALCYQLYNGYWFLVPVVWLAQAWWWRGEKYRVRNVILLSLGIATTTLLAVGVGTVCGGRHYWETMGAFSNSVTQGLFAEGWRLPWEFLWESEKFFGIFVLACIAFGLGRMRLAIPRRIQLWLILLGFAYGLLVLFSTGLARFVVYGRTVLPFAPFLCLLGGWGLSAIPNFGRRTRLPAFAAIAVLGAFQIRPHFFRIFPAEIETAVLKNYGVTKHSLSVSGSIYIPLALEVTRPDLVLVNAQLLYPIRGPLDFPTGRTLLEFDHPLSYRPFQYESHTPAERAFLRTHDISIRLIQLTNPGAVPNDLPPLLRFRSEERPTGK